MKISEILEQIEKFGPSDSNTGICSNVMEFSSDHDVCMWNIHCDQCFREWDDFSGDTEFPIRGMINQSPMSAYITATSAMMWNPNHPYGAARYRLLNHCIKWFKDKNL